jgi:D-methionine transport system substrate-binding protein
MALNNCSRRDFLGLIGIGAGTFALAGCGSTSSSDSATADAEEDKTIVVAASPTPHAEILNGPVKEALEADGWTLEVKEFTDYVLPNTATEEGEVDANYFQHLPYLESFNEEKGTDIVSVAAVHFEPFGLYAGRTASLDELPDGAVVAVPNDTTNEARALLLLEQEGLIKLADGAGINATTKDIVENPKNLEIKELEAATIPSVLADVDIAAINGNYALDAGYTPKDALATEDADGLAAETYANIIAVKAGNEETEKTKALVAAIQTDEVKQFIDETFDGGVVAVF